MEPIQIKDHQRPFVKVPDWVINPPHRLEFSVVGCGGTGSQVLQGLARMNYALESLGHPGIHVIAYDFDKVEESNIGRQLFSYTDLGKNKAACLIEKVNRFYGTSWEYKPRKFNPANIKPYSFILTCVDVIKPRHEIYKTIKNSGFMGRGFWVDFGNGKATGQVVMGGHHLHSIGDVGIPLEDDPSTPSCSLAEALEKQDLMINTMVANAGISMLWSMFRTLKITYNMVFINLEQMKVSSTLKQF